MARIPAVILFILYIAVPPFRAYGSEPARFSAASNPVKLFMTLVNAELEYRFHPLFSFHVFSEYLVADILIKRDGHPDWVIRTGPRWYPWGNRLDGRSGFLLEPALGYTFGRERPEQTGFTAGAGLGYRKMFGHNFFILPKALLTIGLRDGSVLPGLELLAGAVF